jgi:hypothetical protein
LTRLSAVVLAVLAGSTLACSSSSTAPTSLLPAGTHQSDITAVSGTGRGGVSVTPKAIPEGTMAVDISILLTAARPNATYFVQRAPEIGRALAADGICQRAAGLSPWSPSDPAAASFVTFPLGTGLATVTTAANGTGSLNFEFRAPTIPAGTVFDVMIRFVDNETAPTTELRSGCLTVIVK